ncbi:glutathione peroxidase [Halalkalibacter akibai]|uniref:Glutathione peroxidase n=1 Tax=Halalkalibacter akibai (strain ATCC 43226 / DSM 21942 / CIP 109018 / JCM 9157 / 1139) TaxID=1236973 RepID=W4QY17_HALA3|nr:glutathione peroxidase [Halalkalibacter akibai]GAE37015.1 glutathione peroxidase family protein [Halalkalibacter akibai JCM 9157]
MSVHDFSVKKANGEEIKLDSFEGDVLLIVNTATKCGLAPQFKGLETLHQTYKEQGLKVLGFPCNQFMKQEPVSNEEMAETCQLNFGVTFPLFAKIDVNGKNAHPLYKHLKQSKQGILSSEIKWNFTKFLVDQQGQVVERYAPTVTPDKIEDDIKKLLNK